MWPEKADFCTGHFTHLLLSGHSDSFNIYDKNWVAFFNCTFSEVGVGLTNCGLGHLLNFIT